MAKLEATNYATFLKTDFWREVSEQRRALDGHKCVCCGSEKNLNVHHVLYRESWEFTRIEDLVTLCKSCHTLIHRIQEKYDDNAELCRRLGQNLASADGERLNTNSPFGARLRDYIARSIATVCWEKNCFKTTKVSEYADKAIEVVNCSGRLKLYPPVEDIMVLLAFAKDCYIANRDTSFNKEKRKERVRRKTKFK